MTARRQRGFTLIEVVVAFAIFAMSVGALYEAFGAASRRSVNARNRELAWMTADSLLAQQRVQPTPWRPEDSGVTNSGVHWRIQVAPFEAGTSSQSPWHAVRVTVRAGVAADESKYVLLSSVEMVRISP
jgi:general secretion pathway protein I